MIAWAKMMGITPCCSPSGGCSRAAAQGRNVGPVLPWRRVISTGTFRTAWTSHGQADHQKGGNLHEEEVQVGVRVVELLDDGLRERGVMPIMMSRLMPFPTRS